MSRRRNKKKGEEEHISEAWLLPYADLLTLLLALFIVLFAMSSVDAVKFQKLSKAFSGVFYGGESAFELPSPIIEGESEDISEEGGSEQEQLEAIRQKINLYIEERNLSDRLSTSLTEEGLLVTIHDSVLFESGSAEVRIQDEKIAEEISELLVMDQPRDIVISGHTDNVPISTSQFASNWELSVMRAVNFMKIMLENERLDPLTFSAKGFGEFRPIADNETDKGKAENRRVEILILPKTEE